VHGQSGPIERALREAAVVFYSFRPVDTDRYRRAVLGENKNNERDAEAVARFALSLRDQGKLERWRRVWEPDADLRLVSRRHTSVSKEMTAETNRLWKLLRQASPDLYLALGGKLQGVDSPPKMLRNEGILALLSGQPQIGDWQKLSEDQLMQAMGGGEYKGRRAFVRQLKTVTGSFPRLSSSMSMVIRGSTQQLRSFKGELGDLQGMLKELAAQRPAVQKLMQMPGIGTLTATGIVAEIIDIRRFPSEDHLASYSGLGRVERVLSVTVRWAPGRVAYHRSSHRAQRRMGDGVDERQGAELGRGAGALPVLAAGEEEGGAHPGAVVGRGTRTASTAFDVPDRAWVAVGLRGCAPPHSREAGACSEGGSERARAGAIRGAACHGQHADR